MIKKFQFCHNKEEVLKSIRQSNYVPEAMLVYIMRNGCSGFRCGKCPLGLVCDRYPSHSRDYAFSVLTEARKRLSESIKPTS